jgi:hypothetical protein
MYKLRQRETTYISFGHSYFTQAKVYLVIGLPFRINHYNTARKHKACALKMANL